MPYAALLAILDRQTFELISFLPVSIACCQTLFALNIQIQKLIYMNSKCWNLKNVLEFFYNCNYIGSVPGKAIDTIWSMVLRLPSHATD